MKNTLFFLLLLLAGSTTLFAQPLQTLYYSNGKKLMEGRWTFVKKSFVFQTLDMEYYGVPSQTDGANLKNAKPDGDTALMQVYHWGKAGDPAAYLNVNPEGPVTYWIYKGEGYIQITYKNGIPNGPFAEYYAPGQLLQKGNLTNGMPDGPWTYFYKNGKPLYSGSYKAYSQAQLERLWAGDYSGTKANSAGSYSYWQNDIDQVVSVSTQMGASMPFNNILLPGTQKDGRFTFWHKEGTKQAEIVFNLNQPAGTWKIWGSNPKMPVVILELEGSQVRFITDSTGRRRTLEETRQHLKAQMEESRKLLGDYRYEVPVAPDRLSTPFTLVEQIPKFRGNLNEWLNTNLRYPPAAKEEYIDGRVIVKFVIQEDGSVTDAKVEKGVQPDLDAEALRLINAMPAWEPGRQNGKPVKVYFRVPVRFQAE